MNTKQALAKLKSLGTAQTRKTYGRHGVCGEMFGVKYGDMYKLVKQIGTDHDLALELWGSNNHDARILATMIADPDRITTKLLNQWIKAVDNHVLSAALAAAARKSTAGQKQVRKWMVQAKEWRAATGWMALSGMATEPGLLGEKESRELLKVIERQIHNSANRVKYSMNTAMISIGSYVPGLEDHAVKVADRIGQVEVDHGLTNCQTPLASPYIRKAAAHHRAKLAKAAKAASTVKARKKVAPKAPKRGAGRTRTTAP